MKLLKSILVRGYRCSDVVVVKLLKPGEAEIQVAERQNFSTEALKLQLFDLTCVDFRLQQASAICKGQRWL